MKTTLFFSLIFASILFCFVAVKSAKAQGSLNYKGGLKVYFNQKDSSRYFRFIMWHQFYSRYIQNNPGTMVNGKPEAGSWDMGIRRSRYLVYSQINKRFLVLSHWGINNQTFTNGGAPGYAGGPNAGKKPQLYMHDLWGEYNILPYTDEDGKRAKNYLAIGTGLHIYNGISRLSNNSTLNFLLADAPIFNWPNIELKDQFARQPGVFAKGFIDRLHFRTSIVKPFNYYRTPTVANVAVEAPTNNFATKGYFCYQFWDQESFLLPYIGTKKVFNIGAGFYNHQNANHYLNDNGGTEKHAVTHLGADVFLDMPFGEANDGGMALTLYGVFYRYDFGPNYLRSAGIMNIADGTADPEYTGNFYQTQGFGNKEFLMGTGNIAHVQAGLVLPKSILGETGRLQPMASVSYLDFEALEDPGLKYTVGCNLFLEGHHARIRGQYQSRQLYNVDKKADGRAGEFIVETQLYF